MEEQQVEHKQKEHKSEQLHYLPVYRSQSQSSSSSPLRGNNLAALQVGCDSLWEGATTRREMLSERQGAPSLSQLHGKDEDEEPFCEEPHFYSPTPKHSQEHFTAEHIAIIHPIPLNNQSTVSLPCTQKGSNSLLEAKDLSSSNSSSSSSNSSHSNESLSKVLGNNLDELSSVSSSSDNDDGSSCLDDWQSISKTHRVINNQPRISVMGELDIGQFKENTGDNNINNLDNHGQQNNIMLTSLNQQKYPSKETPTGLLDHSNNQQSSFQHINQENQLFPGQIQLFSSINNIPGTLGVSTFNDLSSHPLPGNNNNNNNSQNPPLYAGKFRRGVRKQTTTIPMPIPLQGASGSALSSFNANSNTNALSPLKNNISAFNIINSNEHNNFNNNNNNHGQQQFPHSNYTGSAYLTDSPISKKKNNNHHIPHKRVIRNYLSIIYYVRKFATMLKTASIAYKFRSMNKRHFDMIGDVSSDYSYFRLRSFLQADKPNFFELSTFRLSTAFRQAVWNPLQNHKLTKLFLKQINGRIRVIPPEAFSKQLWDILAILIILVNICFIPVRISFYFNSPSLNTLSNSMDFLFYTLPLIILVIDVILHFNTAFYKQGLLIFNRSQIARNYINSQFFLDLLVIFPYFLSILLDITELKAVVILRFPKILQKIKQFEERLNLNDTQAAYVGLFKLIFMIAFIAHMCGCSFFLVSQIETFYYPNDYQTWAGKQVIEGESVFSQYITSLYWAVITMITLGYGDIVPVNTIERGFIVILTMFSCGVFAFSLNRVGQILLEIGKRENEQKKKINMLMDLMHKRGLTDVQLLMKIRRNFQYLLNQEQENSAADGQKFLLKLDGDLQKEVMRDIYGKILQKKKMFKLNFSAEFIDELCLKMQEQTFAPEDIILHESRISKKIYFILQGEAYSYINLTQKNKKTTNNNVNNLNNNNNCQQSQSNSVVQQVLSHMNKGEVFGEKSFFSGAKSEYGVKACSVVTVAYITIEDFMECVKESEFLDLERFCVLRDNLQVYNVTKGLGVRCFGCNQYTHTTIHCPHSNYVPNQEKLLFIAGLSVDQERSPMIRKSQRAKNTCHIQEFIHGAAIKFIVENIGYDALNSYLDNTHQNSRNINNNNTVQHKNNHRQVLNKEQFRQQSLKTLKRHSAYVNDQQSLYLQQQQLSQNVDGGITSPRRESTLLHPQMIIPYEDKQHKLLQQQQQSQQHNSQNHNQVNNQKMFVNALNLNYENHKAENNNGQTSNTVKQHRHHMFMKDLSIITDEMERSSAQPHSENEQRHIQIEQQQSHNITVGGAVAGIDNAIQNSESSYNIHQPRKSSAGLIRKQQEEIRSQFQSQQPSISSTLQYHQSDTESIGGRAHRKKEQMLIQQSQLQRQLQVPIRAMTMQSIQLMSSNTNYDSQSVIQRSSQQGMKIQNLIENDNHSEQQQASPLSQSYNQRMHVRAALIPQSQHCHISETISMDIPKSLSTKQKRHSQLAGTSTEHELQQQSPNIHSSYQQYYHGQDEFIEEEADNEDDQYDFTPSQFRDIDGDDNNININNVNNNNEVDKNEFAIIKDFDAQKYYEFYFPHNNLQKVLESIQQQTQTIGKQRAVSLNNKQDIQKMIQAMKNNQQKNHHSNARKSLHSNILSNTNNGNNNGNNKKKKKSIFTLHKSENNNNNTHVTGITTAEHIPRSSFQDFLVAHHSGSHNNQGSKQNSHRGSHSHSHSHNNEDTKTKNKKAAAKQMIQDFEMQIQIVKKLNEKSNDIMNKMKEMFPGKGVSGVGQTIQMKMQKVPMIPLKTLDYKTRQQRKSFLFEITH